MMFLSRSFNLSFQILKKTEKATTDHATGESELKEANPIEKAEKDFWKIIDDEKRKRDRKTVLVCFLLNTNYSHKTISFHRLMKKLQQKVDKLNSQHKRLNKILFYFERNFHTLFVCLALRSKYKKYFKKRKFASIDQRFSIE
jgi:hypothetical protein